MKKFIKDIADNILKKLKEQRELNKEIQEEVRKIRLEGRKNRIISVEKAKQEHRKDEEVKAIKQKKKAGKGFSNTLGSFQDFATNFAKSQEGSSKKGKNQFGL